MAQILMVFAQFERETIQRRVTDSYFGRAKSGLYLGGLPPFGFRKGETVWNGRRTACYVPDPEQAAQIPMLYETYVRDGESLGTLSRHLTGRRNPHAHRRRMEYAFPRAGCCATPPLSAQMPPYFGISAARAPP